MKTYAEQFFHHLHDTLTLLGAGQRFAKLVEFPETIKIEDVDALRNYNCKLIDLTKDKLVNLNKIAIFVEPPEQEPEF